MMVIRKGLQYGGLNDVNTACDSKMGGPDKMVPCEGNKGALSAALSRALGGRCYGTSCYLFSWVYELIRYLRDPPKEFMNP
ncbi:hypothetical protein TNCT_338231 [Trichonephila clavata]|uniref:Uncharacterized protein n=1 Tax=Trichonephila clavata TaxID=2740835 RepID=A0A8X6FRJ8_TRICU|nr:hypothetical protein TNCT_338231 [Trichonephila clavata]